MGGIRTSACSTWTCRSSLRGGALVPLAFWMLTMRWFHRPWLAALAAATGGALGIWGLTSWWAPYQAPEFGY